MRTLYALEAFNGSTGLYLDPARRRFAFRVDRPLAEGEAVSATSFGDCVVTWAEPEAIRYVAEDRAAMCARYNARVAAVAAKAA